MVIVACAFVPDNIKLFKHGFGEVVKLLMLFSMAITLL